MLRNALLDRTRTPGGFRKTTEGPALFRKLSPQTACDKCPSLKALLDEMHLLVREAGLS